MIPDAFLKSARLYPTDYTDEMGVPVLKLSLPNGPTTTVLISFHSGVAYESSDEWGISHFIEHMVFRGSKSHPTLYEITRAAESLGGRISAFSTRNLTCYWIKTPFGQEKEIFSILDNLLFKPVFSNENITKEKEIIKQERLREINNPSFHNSLLLEEILLSPSPSCRHPIGEDHIIDTFDSNTLKKNITQTYNRSNVYISASGRFSDFFTGHLNSFIEKVKPGKIPPGGNSLEIPEYKENNTFFIKSHHKNQAFVSMGWKLPDSFNHSITEFRVLNSLLGSGYTSLFNKVLREEQNLTYLCTTQLNSYGNEHIYKINFSSSDSKALYAISLVKEIINKVSCGQFSIESFNEAVVKHCSHILFKLEDSLETAKMLSSEFGRDKSVFSIKDYFNELSKVLPEQVSDSARRFLPESDCKILIKTGSDELLQNRIENSFIISSK